MDPLDAMAEHPMSRYQKLVIAAAIAVIIVDGLDLAIMAYSAASIAAEWQIPPSFLGYLLSASLFGLAAGAILLTPLADVIGRRRLTIVGFAIGLVGMVGATISFDPAMLLVARLITGFGFGGVMANLIVVVSEYSSRARRGALISWYSAGYPIGATLGGFLAGPLLATTGWRSVFLTATIISGALFVVCIMLIPESIAFLVAKRPARALERVNVLLRRMGRDSIAELPDAPTSQKNRSAARAVLTPPQLIRSLLLWLAYGCLAASFYFVNSWVPRMIATASGDEGLGVMMGTLVSAGGIAGGIVFGLLALRFRAWRLLVLTLILSSVSYLVFGAIYEQTGIAIFVAVSIGTLTSAAIAGFYVLATEVYTSTSRATGTGWMIGVGRLASIAAPITVGFLLEGGWSPSSLFFLFATPFLVSAAAVAVSRRSRQAPVAQRSTAGKPSPAQTQP